MNSIVLILLGGVLFYLSVKGKGARFLRELAKL